MAVAISFTDDAGGLSTVLLDAVPQETHSGSAQVTQHPVERGAAITDHVRADPETLTISAVVSDHPLRNTDLSVEQQSIAAVQGIGAAAIGGGYVEGRAARTYAQLLSLKDVGALCSVTTSVRHYEDMVLTDLQRTREAAGGTSLRFSATFRRVRLVESQIVQMSTGGKREAPKTTGGQQPMRPADATTEDLAQGRLKSWAAHADDARREWLGLPPTEAAR